MEHMGKEKLFGYGLVDESQWQEQINKGADLLNSFNNNINTTKNSFLKSPAAISKAERSAFNPKTSVYQTSREEDLEYAKKRDAYNRERATREGSTKVKVIVPTTLKSYQMLKEAERMLMSAEYDVLTQNARNNLACITLNNMGCFYRKLNYNKVALQHFELVLKLENSLGANSVSKVETMLNICANLSN